MAYSGIFEDALSGEGAKTIGQELFDRDNIAIGRRLSWPFGDFNNAAAFPVASKTVSIRMPSWIESGDFLVLDWRGSVTGGATGNVRLGIDAVTGTADVVTTTTVTWYQAEVTLGAWAGTTKLLEIQDGITAGAGTMTTRSANILGNLWFKAQ